uniref:Uncharacterized protein n=1 Tax=Amphimedon queenslandica TaxID=400682 RepID=A0A1X7UCJ5_AMPQE
YFFYLGPQVFIIFGQQCSAASTWRCLGSLVATAASDAKSTTYKKRNNNTKAEVKMKYQVECYSRLKLEIYILVFNLFLKK